MIIETTETITVKHQVTYAVYEDTSYLAYNKHLTVWHADKIETINEAIELVTQLNKQFPTKDFVITADIKKVHNK